MIISGSGFPLCLLYILTLLPTTPNNDMWNFKYVYMGSGAMYECKDLADGEAFLMLSVCPAETSACQTKRRGILTTC